MLSFLMLKNKTMVCTSIEQSNRLIELGINPNTADMGWFKAYSLKGEVYKPFIKEYKLENHKTDIPAWSLLSLIKLMPCEVTFNDEAVIINNKRLFGTHTNVFDNLIDAIQYLKDNNELNFN